MEREADIQKKENAPGNTSGQELSVIRGEIDRVDREVKTLFLERMALSKQVARVKAQTEDRIFKPDREAAILENQTKGLDDQIIMEYRAFLRRMMEISRKYQYGLTLKMRDCFPFAYVQKKPEINRLAMVREELYICDFCSKDEVLAARSFEEIGKWIGEGTVDAGAGIIERIGTGVSDELNAMLMRRGLYICESRVVTLEEEKYKVVIFSKELAVMPEHNRVKLVFTAPNRSGALGSVLSMIADYGVNLTEIHSIPYRTGEDWNYRFFAELSANLLDEETRALVFQLSQETMDLKLLGSYRCEGDFVR